MGDNTAIEWTDATWSPIRARHLATGKVGWHCTHASEGCRFCYAEGINRRLGTGLDFKPVAAREVEIFLDEKMLLAPIRWARPRMIFVCSMTDLFADFVPDWMIDRIFAVMALCPQHIFQVLTKRSERMRAYMLNWPQGAARFHHMSAEAHKIRPGMKVGMPDGFTWELQKRWPLPNVWMGMSAEAQPEFDQRWEHLKQTPAALRWVSYEPMLGPIDASAALASGLLHWGVGGGESGRNARPMHPDWPRALCDDHSRLGVPWLFKQWGDWVAGEVYSVGNQGGFARHQDPNKSPFQGARSHWWSGDTFGGVISTRVGKKAAGRMLDGVIHDGMPQL